MNSKKTKAFTKAFMTYLEPDQHIKLKRFASKTNVPMAQVIRESLDIRLAPGEQYLAGFNNGLQAAMTVISEHKASQMRFPSGKSFAELLNEEINKHFMENNDEGATVTQKPAPGSEESSASRERQADVDLGV